MDPRLIEEVIYLHSLWHQGPPRSHSSSNLQPTSSTQFKKHRRPGPRTSNRNPPPPPPPVSDLEWPCNNNPTPNEPVSGWPIFPNPPIPKTHIPSPLEQARLAATRAQHNALKAVNEFLKFEADDDGGGDDDDDSDEEEEGCKEYKFFDWVFMEDGDLKDYYAKNFGNGQFSCLVCCGAGEKTLKKFKNCLALVQHSITVVKTKKRQAHRAYGQVVCKVLGWDIDRLHTAVLPTPAELGTEKPTEEQVLAQDINQHPTVALPAGDELASDKMADGQENFQDVNGVDCSVLGNEVKPVEVDKELIMQN